MSLFAFRRDSSLLFCLGVLTLVLSGCIFSRPRKMIVPPPPQTTPTGYLIDQPEVRQRITEYPTVTFTPGEVIRVSAAGCVQTGGRGKTWKDYVRPQGPDASRLYHGLIWIPGVTPGLVRLGWLNGRPLKIPAGADPSQLYLRLGYEDDYYPDNGYYKPDPGTSGQCKTQGNARVEIQRQAPGSPESLAQAPFDLTLEMKDGLAANPGWVYYNTHTSPPDAEQPSLCGHFKGDDGEIRVDPETCSTQQPGVDYATLSSLHTIVCHLNDVLHPELVGKLHGHANWFPGVYVGEAIYTGISADRDVNFLMKVAGPSAMTAYPKDDGGIELEFASDETIYHFATPWWRKFASVARNNNEARGMLTGKVVVGGLIGIDNEHEAHAEVHPVYGLALQTADPPAGEDVWAIFVRNWGDEGFCSQDRHYLDLPRNRFVLEIPWPDGATGVTVDYVEPGNSKSITRSFRTNNAKAAVAVPVILGDRRFVRLAFELPPPQEGGRIAGDLHLHWTNVGPPVRIALAEPAEHEDSAESALEKKLGARGFAAATAPPNNPKVDQLIPKLLSEGAQANFLAPAPASPVTPPQPRPDQAVADPAKADRDKSFAKAICAAIDPKNPESKDLAAACKDIRFKKAGKQ